MPIGLVKLVKDGYGFIQPSIFGENLFFHARQCTVSMSPTLVGQRVEYEIEKAPDGRNRAANVRPASSAPGPAVMDGTIKTVAKGYGFIEVASGNYVFFHRTHIDAPVDERLIGQRVTFEMDFSRDQRGQAVGVRLQPSSQ